MAAQLKAFGRIDLDGTHRAILETAQPTMGGLEADLGRKAVFLKLERNGAACGVLLAEVRYSHEERIIADRYKLDFLGAHDNDEVAVTAVEPAEARTVRFSVAQGVTERDLLKFVGRPFIRGEVTHVFTLSGEPRPVEVVGTEPEGLVILSKKTRMEVSRRTGREKERQPRMRT